MKTRRRLSQDEPLYDDESMLHDYPAFGSPNRHRRLGLRFDMKGTPIIRGSKAHRVTFKKQMKDVIIVENWKIHNFGTQEDEKTCPCSLI
jgi:gentisate 1,2-dioxygenase